MEKVLLANSNGEFKKGIRIKIHSKFDNSIEKIWNKILNIETLIYLCKPMATFKQVVNEKITKWETNKEYVFKLFIYGFIPFGKHKITLDRIDKNNGLIISKEHNNIVKIWNHKIIMESKGEKVIEYTDEVELYAGIFTLFVAFWGILFYKHRQKKWRKIAIGL
jgi:hypothetical protein